MSGAAKKIQNKIGAIGRGPASGPLVTVMHFN